MQSTKASFANSGSAPEEKTQAKRRLIVFDGTSSADLQLVTQRIGVTFSEAVRLGIHLAAERLRENPPEVAKTLIPDQPDAHPVEKETTE